MADSKLYLHPDTLPLFRVFEEYAAIAKFMAQQDIGVPAHHGCATEPLSIVRTPRIELDWSLHWERTDGGQREAVIQITLFFPETEVMPAVHVCYEAARDGWVAEFQPDDDRDKPHAAPEDVRRMEELVRRFGFEKDALACDKAMAYRILTAVAEMFKQLR